ncbi:unnamed protein product [Ectocarpus fasciculatus]
MQCAGRSATGRRPMIGGTGPRLFQLSWQTLPVSDRPQQCSFHTSRSWSPCTPPIPPSGIPPFVVTHFEAKARLPSRDLTMFSQHAPPAAKLGGLPDPLTMDLCFLSLNTA